MNDACLVVLPGEGIGPEVTAEGLAVARLVAEVVGFPLAVETHEVGEVALKLAGNVFPANVESACDRAAAHPRGAILFGAVSDEPIGILRKKYDLFANLRPIRMWPVLLSSSPLKPSVSGAIDLVIVRELVSDVYYGEARAGVDARGAWASQEMFYAEPEVRRITRVALALAQERRGRLVLVHKGNVIKDVFAIWSRVLREEQARHPAVACSEALVDNMAMQMVLRPAAFDVVLCSNLFGDILSDLGAGLLGSLGLLPSVSFNERGFGLYEPVSGTAPDIAGQGIANPLASILSVAMWCRHTLKLPGAAGWIEDAAQHVLASYRTADLALDGRKLVGTLDMGAALRARLRATAQRVQGDAQWTNRERLPDELLQTVR